MTRDRLLSIALFISVAVNIFAVAVFLGPVFHHGPTGPDGPGRGFGHGLGKYQLEGLSETSQDNVRAIWRDSRRDLYRQFRESAKARKALTAALTAETYDEQAVIDAQLALDQAMDRVRALTNKAVLDSAGVLTNEERAAFFAFGFHPDRHGGPKGPGEYKRRPFFEDGRKGGPQGGPQGDLGPLSGPEVPEPRMSGPDMPGGF